MTGCVFVDDGLLVEIKSLERLQAAHAKQVLTFFA